jgi:hypothetical protein
MAKRAQRRGLWRRGDGRPLVPLWERSLWIVAFVGVLALLVALLAGLGHE